MIELLIGAGIGVSGQVTRFAVAFYKQRKAEQPFKFDGWLFTVGAYLGATCGALATWKWGLAHDMLPALWLAGYAGADFIEGGLK